MYLNRNYIWILNICYSLFPFYHHVSVNDSRSWGMAGCAIAAKISTAETGCYCTGISLCSVCAFSFSRGDHKPDWPVPIEHLYWEYRLSQGIKMHRKLTCCSQEMWILKKPAMIWYFCVNLRLLTFLEKEFVAQSVRVPPGSPSSRNVFKQMCPNWSYPSQSNEPNNLKICHEMM